MQIRKENIVTNSVFLLAGLFLLLWAVFGKSYPVICTDASRLATIESLVNQGTFEISDSIFVGTCDKIRIPPQGEGGVYISDKPPLLSIIGAGIYGVLKAFQLDFRTDLETVFKCLVFFLSAMPVLLIFYFLNLYLSAHKVSLENRGWIYLSAVFGTLVLPYAMVLQNHTITAALLLGSYVYLENPMQKRLTYALTLSGLLLGLAVSMDLNTIFFAMTFSLVVLWEQRKNLASVLFFILPLGIPIFFTWFLFLKISGHWTPFVAQADGYFYEGSILPRTNNIGGFDDKPLSAGAYFTYFWQGFLGYRGMLSHSIALVLGGWGLILFARKNSRNLCLATSVLSAVLILWLFLGFKIPITFGGSNFGFRYMAIWMPLVMVFAFQLFQEKSVQNWMKGIIAISILTSGLGMLSPWQVHSFDQLEAKNFDFLLVHDLSSNPYLQHERTLQPFKEEVRELKSKKDHESLMKLAFLYYQAMRPAEALGYLDLIDKENPDRECYKGVMFSKRGLNLKDIMQRHVDKCPKEKWAELSAKMQLDVEQK